MKKLLYTTNEKLVDKLEELYVYFSFKAELSYNTKKFTKDLNDPNNELVETLKKYNCCNKAIVAFEDSPEYGTEEIFILGLSSPQMYSNKSEIPDVIDYTKELLDEAFMTKLIIEDYLSKVTLKDILSIICDRCGLRGDLAPSGYNFFLRFKDYHLLEKAIFDDSEMYNMFLSEVQSFNPVKLTECSVLERIISSSGANFKKIIKDYSKSSCLLKYFGYENLLSSSSVDTESSLEIEMNVDQKESIKDMLQLYDRGSIYRNFNKKCIDEAEDRNSFKLDMFDTIYNTLRNLGIAWIRNSEVCITNPEKGENYEDVIVTDPLGQLETLLNKRSYNRRLKLEITHDAWNTDKDCVDGNIVFSFQNSNVGKLYALEENHAVMKAIEHLYDLLFECDNDYILNGGDCCTQG